MLVSGKILAAEAGDEVDIGVAGDGEGVRGLGLGDNDARPKELVTTGAVLRTDAGTDELALALRIVPVRPGMTSAGA